MLLVFCMMDDVSQAGGSSSGRLFRCSIIHSRSASASRQLPQLFRCSLVSTFSALSAELSRYAEKLRLISGWGVEISSDLFKPLFRQAVRASSASNSLERR